MHLFHNLERNYSLLFFFFILILLQDVTVKGCLARSANAGAKKKSDQPRTPTGGSTAEEPATIQCQDEDGNPVPW